jgi:uncharacterized membrane protein YebE (DUF533 family)
MSLAKTLIKVAIGVAVAKGVSTLAKNATGGNRSASTRPSGVDNIMDGIGGAGTGRRYQPQEDSIGGEQGGSLGDLLGQLTGQSAPRRNRTNAPSGGLEDLLGGGQSGGGGGGLGDLLGQLAGGGQTRQTQQSGGGLGDLLGQLTGAGNASRGATQSGGGLGDLLGQLTGAGGGSAQGGGLGDLLGAVLGGAAGGAASGGLAGGGDQRREDLAAALILRAMVSAVKADGKLDADEKQKLMQHMDGASREEIAYVNAELERRTNVSELARQVPEGMEAQVYVMSLMAIDLDNQKEAQYLDQLAKELALEPREVNALHDKAGAPRLYN